MEPTSYLIVADKVMGLANKIFAFSRTRAKASAEERKRIAVLLEKIEREVAFIGQQINRKIIPVAACEAAVTYSKQVPPILTSVYSEEIANQIGLTLAEVFETRSVAEVILASKSPDSTAQLN